MNKDREEVEYGTKIPDNIKTEKRSIHINKYQLTHFGGIVLFILTIVIPAVLDIQLLTRAADLEEFTRFELVQSKYIILIFILFLGSVTLIGLSEKAMSHKYRKIKLILWLVIGGLFLLIGFLSEKEFFQNWFIPADRVNFFEDRMKFETFLDRFRVIGAFVTLSALLPYGRTRRIRRYSY